MDRNDTVKMRLKETRLKNRITQAEAAKLLGCSKRTYEEWEKEGNRNPKGGYEALIHKLNVAGILTREWREALVEGEYSWKEAEDTYKLQQAKMLSKWGGYPTTFAAILARVPESVYEALNGEQLAELVDAIQEAYSAGKAAGREEKI